MATTADSSSSQLDCDVNAAGSGSSVWSPSSSSSSDGHSGFFKSRSRQESPSTTPLCFGAGGVRGSRSRARAVAKHQQEAAAAIMAPKVMGDVVGRYLRKISKGPEKARRSDGKRAAPPSSVAAVDDTARDRAECVARAISYCKDTLWRGATRSRPRRTAVWPLGMQTTAKRCKQLLCPASPGSLAATAVAHGEESPRHGGCRGASMSSLDEMEFLKTFDGDEEMINHHFITVEI